MRLQINRVETMLGTTGKISSITFTIFGVEFFAAAGIYEIKRINK